MRKAKKRKLDSEKSMIWNHDQKTFKREGPSSVAFEKYIYIFGGSDPIKKIYDKNIYRFNTETLNWDTYELKGEVLPRKCHSAVIFDKDIILFGGMSKNSGEYVGEVATINIEKLEYSHVELVGDELDTERSKHGYGISGSKMYILGGEKDKKKTKFDDFYEIDVSSKPFVVKSLPSMPKKLFSIRCIINSKSIFTFGGINQGAHRDVYEYSFDKCEWMTRNIIPFGFRCSYSCQLLNEDVGLFYGGYDSSIKVYYNTIYKYDIPLDKWTLVDVGSSTPPLGSAYSTSTIIGSTFYLFGGYGGNQTYVNGMSWMIFPFSQKIHLTLFQNSKIFRDISFTFK